MMALPEWINARRNSVLKDMEALKDVRRWFRQGSDERRILTKQILRLEQESKR